MKQEIIHYPNLKTVLMVEKVLKNANKPISKNEILRRLPNKTMFQTLNIILNYLEEKAMIHIGEKGVIWIYNPSLKMKKALRRSVEI